MYTYIITKKPKHQHIFNVEKYVLHLNCQMLYSIIYIIIFLYI